MGYFAEKFKEFKVQHRFNYTFFGQLPTAERLVKEQTVRFNRIRKLPDTETKLKTLFCDHFEVYREKRHSRKNSLHLANIAVRTLYEYVKDNKK
jgi:hypothetical protein